jgi:hypothetical protein
MGTVPADELPRGFSEKKWNNFRNFLNSSKNSIDNVKASFLKAAKELCEEFPEMAVEIKTNALGALAEANKTASFSAAEERIGRVS